MTTDRWSLDVGDVDPLAAPVHAVDLCDAGRAGFECTRRAAHPSPHVATDLADRALAIWDDDVYVDVFDRPWRAS